MNKNFLIILILSITGCSKQLPECSSVEVLDILQNAYHEKKGSNDKLINLKFDMITTISIDKETGSKKCSANATVSYKKPIIDWLESIDWLKEINYSSGVTMLVNSLFVPKKDQGLIPVYSVRNDLLTTEIQYSIFRDEQDNSYFIKYNNWIENEDFDLGFELIKDNYQEYTKSLVIKKDPKAKELAALEKKAELAAMDKLEELESAATKAKDEAPSKLKKEAPEATRFEKNYFQIEQELMTKIKGSKKVMVVQLAVMTHYDTRVFDNIKKHEFALRSAMIDIMSQYTETETNNPNFRKELAVKLKDVMNLMLEEYEDFGGIDEVMFTSFVLH